MKTKLFAAFLALLALAAPSSLLAQNYAISWYKIAGGGGTSTGGVYSVNGTIGQQDASVAMTGGSYSLVGGFWSMIAVIQSAGVPKLTIYHSGNSVVVAWPKARKPMERINVMHSSLFMLFTYLFLSILPGVRNR